MLNHVRLMIDGEDGGCRRSKKTVSTAPSVSMLIWQARERALAAAMIASDSASAEAAWSQTSLLSAFVDPYASKLKSCRGVTVRGRRGQHEDVGVDGVSGQIFSSHASVQ